MATVTLALFFLPFDLIQPNKDIFAILTLFLTPSADTNSYVKFDFATH